jgi:hypothetical protein
MGLTEELMELDQHTPKLVRDGRTGGLAKVWAWDGIQRRWVRDDAEIAELQTRLRLSSTYPTNPLPVVSWTILQRSVLVGDDPG